MSGGKWQRANSQRNRCAHRTPTVRHAQGVDGEVAPSGFVCTSETHRGFLARWVQCESARNGAEGHRSRLHAHLGPTASTRRKGLIHCSHCCLRYDHLIVVACPDRGFSPFSFSFRGSPAGAVCLFRAFEKAQGHAVVAPSSRCFGAGGGHFEVFRPTNQRRA
ncbi:hypothetical protein MRX96_042546 [Rhipicephalus microplus]